MDNLSQPTASPSHKLRTFLFIILGFIVIGIIMAGIYFFVSKKTQNVPNKIQKVGGQCTYRNIPGTCVVTSVVLTEASKAQETVTGGPGYEGYEVKLDFIPASSSSASIRNYLLTLQNSWYPGIQYLKKYNIENNYIYACNLKKIVKGTCTPSTIDIPTVNATDYFESAQ